MLKDDVRKGMLVSASKSTHYGKAKITSNPYTKTKNSRKYYVDIEYPDLPPTISSSRRSTEISIREITHEWTDADERMFKKHWERIETERGWSEALAESGFSGVTVRYYDADDSFYVSAEGLMAERVLEVLTGETIPKKKEDKDGDD